MGNEAKLLNTEHVDPVLSCLGPFCLGLGVPGFVLDILLVAEPIYHLLQFSVVQQGVIRP